MGAAWAVNYYPHHIGDYLRDTAHLDALEDGTYRRLLDVYYASEKPLPLETHWVCRLVRARTQAEQDAVSEILRQFFERRPDGWHNKRADEEIRKSNRRIKAARNNGKTGGRPITQRVSKKNPVGLHADNPDESSQNQNQKPKTKEEKQIAPSANALSAANGDAVAYIPLNDGSEFGVSEKQVSELEKLYPAVDVRQTLNEIRGWNLANPTRRKTRRGVLSHINAWMSKEQNRGAQR